METNVMYSPLVKTIVAVIIMFFFGGCSTSRVVYNCINNSYNGLLGKWEVSRKHPRPDNTFTIQRGLPDGVIIFYPNTSFMYRNRSERLTGEWHITADTKIYAEYWILDVHVPEQVSLTYKLILTVNTPGQKQIQYSADIIFVDGKKAKLIYGSSDEPVTNILTRN